MKQLKQLGVSWHEKILFTATRLRLLMRIATIVAVVFAAVAVKTYVERSAAERRDEPFRWLKDSIRRYVDGNDHLPDNSSSLSWRAELLPYLGYGTGAYADQIPQVDFSAAWDAPQNRAVERNCSGWPFGERGSGIATTLAVNGANGPFFGRSTIDSSQLAPEMVLLVECKTSTCRWMQACDLDTKKSSLLRAVGNQNETHVLFADWEIWVLDKQGINVLINELADSETGEIADRDRLLRPHMLRQY